MTPERSNKFAHALIALLSLVVVARGVAALWSGEAWVAGKTAPPLHLEGAPALAYGAMYVCFGVGLAAALAPAFGAPRRASLAAAALAGLCALAFAFMSVTA